MLFSLVLTAVVVNSITARPTSTDEDRTRSTNNLCGTLLASELRLACPEMSVDLLQQLEGLPEICCHRRQCRRRKCQLW
jgi:hypothetical protein